MVDMGMHVAVGKQPQKVQRAALFGGGDHFLPSVALPQMAAGDGFGDQFRALGEHAAGADGVVADLAIAHVFVAGHADGLTVRQ